MTAGRIAGIGLGAFLVAQIVPYGRTHMNPPKLAEPEWDSPDTRALFLRSCGDCHSNGTRWPWYSFVAPTSWLVQHDVDEGRSHLNVSQWGQGRQHGDEASEMLRKDEMPPWVYRPLHWDARVRPAEREAFIAGLEATFGKPEKHHDHDR